LHLEPLHIGVNQLMLETALDAEQQELTELIKTSAAGLVRFSAQPELFVSLKTHPRHPLNTP